jgi:hypothetical protein
LTIRDAVHRDRAGACSKFAIDSAQAERISTMSIPQIFALVANVGDVTLFPARRDLLALLDTPLPLTRPIAAVRATRYSVT